VVFSRVGTSTDLDIAIKGTSDHVTVIDQFGASYGAFGALWLDRIEGFKFADGSSYAWDQVIQMLDAQQGQPALYGFDYADTLDGGPGVHYMSGGNESDTYLFGFGDTYDSVEDAATNPIGGMDNTIQFGPGVRPQDVKFSMQGPFGDMRRGPLFRR
jgi:Haemolysin-type calcium binding protein related domain